MASLQRHDGKKTKEKLIVLASRQQLVAQIPQPQHLHAHQQNSNKVGILCTPYLPPRHATAHQEKRVWEFPHGVRNNKSAAGFEEQFQNRWQGCFLSHPVTSQSKRRTWGIEEIQERANGLTVNGVVPS